MMLISEESEEIIKGYPGEIQEAQTAFVAVGC